MEFEFWWLLALPVFFGRGWMAARVDLKNRVSDGVSQGAQVSLSFAVAS